MRSVIEKITFEIAKALGEEGVTVNGNSEQGEAQRIVRDNAIAHNREVEGKLDELRMRFDVEREEMMEKLSELKAELECFRSQNGILHRKWRCWRISRRD